MATQHETTGPRTYRGHRYQIDFQYAVENFGGEQMKVCTRIRSTVDGETLTLRTPGYEPSENPAEAESAVRKYIDYKIDASSAE